jgi:tRNA dimethylallyltransferase
MTQRSALPCLVILGPTASGKTRLAVRLARALGGEIVSADSRQVYRRLDIGSGKDLAEYVVDGDPVKYHLIDIADLSDEFSVFDYQRHCCAVLAELHARGTLPILTGGTGLYIEAVTKSYGMVEAPEDPELRAKLAGLSNPELESMLREIKPGLHNTTDVTDRNRIIRAIEIARATRSKAPAAQPDIAPIVLGVRWPREELKARIQARLRDRMGLGLVEEIEGLLSSGVPHHRLDTLGLELRFVGQFLRGEIWNRNDLTQKLGAAIAEFARKQESWFRRMERHGTTIHWIDRGDYETALRIARNQLATQVAPAQPTTAPT